MLRLIFVFLLTLAVMMALACAGGRSNTTSNSTTAANAGTNANGGPTEIKLDPANMPPGLSASPIVINGNANRPPGIPGNVNGAKRGTTPTPGIPSEQEIKKMMQKPGSTPPPANAPVMMKSNRP
jgi:hypothetical protein